MHEQGTGGAPKYGTVAQLPLVGNISNPLSSITVGRAVSDQGSVGYYKAVTSQQVIVEMAATSRAGMYQYTFPSSSGGNNILIDVSHVLPSFRGQGLGQGYEGGSFELFPDGHYEASGIYNNGWNRSPDWTIYSCKPGLLLLTSILTRFRRILQHHTHCCSSVYRNCGWRKCFAIRRVSDFEFDNYRSRRIVHLRQQCRLLSSWDLLDFERESLPKSQ